MTARPQGDLEIHLSGNKHGTPQPSAHDALIHDKPPQDGTAGTYAICRQGSWRPKPTVHDCRYETLREYNESRSARGETMYLTAQSVFSTSRASSRLRSGLRSGFVVSSVKLATRPNMPSIASIAPTRTVFPYHPGRPDAATGRRRLDFLKHHHTEPKPYTTCPPQNLRPPLGPAKAV